MEATFDLSNRPIADCLGFDLAFWDISLHARDCEHIDFVDLRPETAVSLPTGEPIVFGGRIWAWGSGSRDHCHLQPSQEDLCGRNGPVTWEERKG